MRVLNPEPAVRTEGADRLAVELVEEALALPASAPRFRKLAGSLHHLDPRKIAGDDTRAAFWINVYNAMRLHVFHVVPPRISVPLSLSRYRTYAWRIGEHEWSLSIIHHGLLRANRPSLWNWRPMLASGDPRLDAAPRGFDPRIHFALSTGTLTGPRVKRFHSGSLDAELRQAERDYVATHAKIQERHVILDIPPLVRAYRADFGIRTKAEAIDWTIARFPDEKRLWLLARRDRIVAPWKLLAADWTLES